MSQMTRQSNPVRKIAQFQTLRVNSSFLRRSLLAQAAFCTQTKNASENRMSLRMLK